MDTISLNGKETVQQLELLNGKLDRIISLLERQEKIQFYVLASRGVDVLKLIDIDLTDLCAAVLERVHRQRQDFHKKTIMFGFK